jgi:hypothetical protein
MDEGRSDPWYVYFKFLITGFQLTFPCRRLEQRRVA